MSFLDSYIAKVESLMRAAARLDTYTLKSILGLVKDVKRDVTSQIASTDWDASNLEKLLARIDRTGSEMTRELGNSMSAHARSKYMLGGKTIDQLLIEYGGTGEQITRPLDQSKLAILQGYSTDLVRGVSTDTISNISNALRLGMAGAKSPTDIIRELGRSLVTADGDPAPGVWGDTIRRAEVIYRTEGGRVYSLAQQVRMEQHDRVRPGLMKTWLHSFKPPGRARPSHVQAERDYKPGGDPGPIPQSEPFVLHVMSDEASNSLPAGDYECMYPRDPSLPAGCVISCGCVSAPYRAGWENL